MPELSTSSREQILAFDETVVEGLFDFALTYAIGQWIIKKRKVIVWLHI